MKYQELFAHTTDSQALSYLGRLHGLDLSPRTAPAKLQAAVIKRLSDTAYLEAYLARLPAEEQLGLEVAVFGSQSFLPTPDSVHRRLNELNNKNGRRGGKIIAALVNRGLVFAATDRHYRSVYLVPEEVRAAVFALTARRLAGDVPGLPAQPASGFDLLALLNDLHLFLAWLGRTPMRLTQAGLIYRRDQQRLLANFNPPEELPPTSGHAAYPPRLNFFLNFCEKHDLIAPTVNADGWPHLALAPEAGEWMLQSLDHQLQELFTYLKQYLEHPEGTLGMLLALLSNVPEAKWLDLEALLAHLATCAADPWYHPGQEVTAALGKLLSFRLVEVGACAGKRYVRLTAGGRKFRLGILPPVEEEDTFLVQPNYEVLVPQELKPALRWQLEPFTELVKNDRMVVLRLSADSVYQAFKRGKDPGELLPFLCRHSRTPLPENVAYSLEDWCGRCGALYLEQPLLLTCRSEELADEVAADPRFKRYLRGRFTPRHLLVDPDKYNELLAALEKAGYWPHPGVAQEAELEVKAQARLRDQLDALRDLMSTLIKEAGRR
ncbi:MAG: hypothetical protein PWR31_1556 [Bacillota bacterium]|nr:hypothetical protein [Bacillota bacterium]